MSESITSCERIVIAFVTAQDIESSAGGQKWMRETLSKGLVARLKTSGNAKIGGS
jgi:hypothetical protein